jgi:cell division protein FtsI (penicillin-binding protein 3)
MDAVRPDQPTAPHGSRREPWRRRLVRTLLYGRNVDRAAKARARIGLAILVFAVGYSVIAARLVMFAVNSEGHTARRASTQDAVATARPDILDRNGQILSTDVRTPSLFAEPHRIIDVDEASELLTAVMPDIDAAELRERLGQASLRLAQARDHSQAARADLPAWPARHRLPAGEPHLPMAPRSPIIRVTSISTIKV